jgi:hypothetical protein
MSRSTSDARGSNAIHRAFGIFGAALAACKGAEKPRPMPAAGSLTIAATREGQSIRGVASDGTSQFAAFAGATNSVIEARRGSKVTWSATVTGTAGELAIANDTVAVAISARGPASGPTGTQMALRGDPAAVVVALDRASGARRWQRAFESTEWALIHGVAALGPDVLVAGSFGGTLRVADKVVTSGGGSDGFVARLAADGTPVWVVRLGGTLTDGVQGIAVRGERIAIAGTFSLTAELLGEPLKVASEKSPFGDAFAAELDANGKRTWSTSFGGMADEAVAGVAFDSEGRVVVAANIREVLSIGGAPIIPRGQGDGLLVWFDEGGGIGTNVLVGGNDFDGIRSIASAGDQIVIGGFFSGTIALADQNFTAGGGDDSFLAAFDAGGTVATAWHIGGGGREEITALSTMPGGFIAGIAYTAASNIDGEPLDAPPKGSVGAAIVERGR